MRLLALKVPSSEQFGEADFGSQGLCFPRPYRDLLLPHLLQHWRAVAHKYRWFRDSRILLSGGSIQCRQER